MQILTICNHKGGTGKTTTAIHLAAALGHGGQRVLAIDLDPQGFLTHTLKVDEPSPEESSLALIKHDRPLSAIPTAARDAFSLLPYSGQMVNFQRRLNKKDDVFLLREALQDAVGYDIVLIDTAAAITPFVLNALVATDYVIIPVVPEYQPLVGSLQTEQTCIYVRKQFNPKMATPWFMLTQVDKRKRAHQKYRKYLRRQGGDQVLEAVVRTDTILSLTAAHGETAFEIRPSTRGAKDYARVAEEVTDRMGLPAESGEMAE